jgi:hypothetical protein
MQGTEPLGQAGAMSQNKKEKGRENNYWKGSQGLP